MATPTSVQVEQKEGNNSWHEERRNKRICVRLSLHVFYEALFGYARPDQHAESVDHRGMASARVSIMQIKSKAALALTKPCQMYIGIMAITKTTRHVHA